MDRPAELFPRNNTRREQEIIWERLEGVCGKHNVKKYHSKLFCSQEEISFLLFGIVETFPMCNSVLASLSWCCTYEVPEFNGEEVGD